MLFVCTFFKATLTSRFRSVYLCRRRAVRITAALLRIQHQPGVSLQFVQRVMMRRWWRARSKNDLAQQDRNKMADWCHGERATGRDQSPGGQWVSSYSASSHGDGACRCRSSLLFVWVLSSGKAASERERSTELRGTSAGRRVSASHVHRLREATFIILIIDVRKVII